ncbi:hypothetical protein SBA6_150005 [Candidatus Sulfopaludibacter sp. SbA6]|nr:hypothetical protein SBA6_150005 [Candidatus Sulfopaludibacter sp. SbA6]
MRPPGDANLSRVWSYYSWRFKSLCFCGLRREVEIGRRIWGVVFTICVSRGLAKLGG